MKATDKKIIAFRKKILHHISERIKKDISSLGHIIFKMKVENKTLKDVDSFVGTATAVDVGYDLLFSRKKGWFSREKLLLLQIIFHLEKNELTDIKLFIENKDVLPLIRPTLDDLKKKYRRFLKNTKIEEFKRF